MLVAPRAAATSPGASLGGSSVGTIAVTAGETLTVVVGGRPTTAGPGGFGGGGPSTAFSEGWGGGGAFGGAAEWRAVGRGRRRWRFGGLHGRRELRRCGRRRRRRAVRQRHTPILRQRWIPVRRRCCRRDVWRHAGNRRSRRSGTCGGGGGGGGLYGGGGGTSAVLGAAVGGGGGGAGYVVPSAPAAARQWGAVRTRGRDVPTARAVRDLRDHGAERDRWGSRTPRRSGRCSDPRRRP